MFPAAGRAAAQTAMMIRPVGEKAVPVERGKHLVVRAAGQSTQRQHHEEDYFKLHGDRPLGKDERISVNHAL